MDMRRNHRGRRGLPRYRLPIMKNGRRNFVANSREELVERYSIPYVMPYEDIHLKGLLVDSKVYLYDLAEYNFLRFHRGYFGEYNYVTPYDSSKPMPRNEFNSSLDPFPPPSHVFPVASLTLIEAYFLNYACGSLDVWDGPTQKRLLRQDLMRIFSCVDPLFPYFFAAYMHFRRKKYTVKAGLKFGTDFVLYEYGPSKSHSVYSVYVIVPTLRDPGVGAIDAMQRASNAVKKDVLLVQVAGEKLTPEDLSVPDCFERMEIMEVIVRRRETLTNVSDLGNGVIQDFDHHDVDSSDVTDPLQEDQHQLDGEQKKNSVLSGRPSSRAHVPRWTAGYRLSVSGRNRRIGRNNARQHRRY